MSELFSPEDVKGWPCLLSEPQCVLAALCDSVSGEGVWCDCHSEPRSASTEVCRLKADTPELKPLPALLSTALTGAESTALGHWSTAGKASTYGIPY